MVLMFAAGGMIWMNLIPQKVPLNPVMADDINAFAKRAFDTIVSKTSALDVLWDEHYSVTSIGWPCRSVTFNNFEYVCTRRLDLTIAERTHRIHTTGLVTDIALAVGILLLLALASEWLIHRRAKQIARI
jgi:hypothetical protein